MLMHPRTGFATALFLFLSPVSAMAASTWYVAPTGNDTAAGTMSAPFATWARAQTAAAAGDTVYFRGGTYKYTTSTSTCSAAAGGGTSTSAIVNAVVLNKSGSAGNMINYWAYPGETPVFDFSGITDMTNYNCRHASVRVEANYLYLKGLELKGTLQLNSDNHESWCVYITGGSNNKFELINAHHNMGPGFFLTEGGNNTFLNCDSHENEDTLTSNGDGQSADGFGCHPDRTGDSGNIFHGCRAWWNSDDGWDFINASAACTVEYSWSWFNGYKPDAIEGGAPVSLAAGNGNGFKAGGYGLAPATVPTPTPQHVVRFNVAFNNKVNGIYANHGVVSAYFYNNTSYDNGFDFDMLGAVVGSSAETSVGILRNNLAFGHTLTSDMDHGGPISDMFNSWDANLNVTVSDADFQSTTLTLPASCPQTYTPGGTACCAPDDMTCFSGMASARQADGSLPVLPFLRLAAGSDLIDKGTDLGFSYVGKAPDLGAFEYGASEATTGAGGSTTAGTAGGGGGRSSGGAAGGSAAAGGAAAGGGSTMVGPGEGGAAATGSGGSSSSGSGKGGTASGGRAGGSGGSAGANAESSSSAGCGCEMGDRSKSRSPVIAMLSLLGVVAVSRRRRGGVD
jgi:MYXO-CTERM domain-containing protein